MIKLIPGVFLWCNVLFYATSGFFRINTIIPAATEGKKQRKKIAFSVAGFRSLAVISPMVPRSPMNRAVTRYARISMISPQQTAFIISRAWVFLHIGTAFASPVERIFRAGRHPLHGGWAARTPGWFWITFINDWERVLIPILLARGGFATNKAARRIKRGLAWQLHARA